MNGATSKTTSPDPSVAADQLLLDLLRVELSEAGKMRAFISAGNYCDFLDHLNGQFVEIMR